MPTVVTTMCKAGQIDEAYELAKANCASDPTSVWAQRDLGWAIYYAIKRDADAGDYANLVERVEDLKGLNLLTTATDGMIYENVQWQIGMFLKNHIAPNDIDAQSKLSTLFHLLRGYSFSSSKGHSVLLQYYIKFNAWTEMADFLDWWNLENLSDEDYVPFQMPNGNKVMALAERAYIANSKALLNQSNLERIREFLPKLENLMTAHPEMMYPGYFYGKLLLKLGDDEEETLKVVVPFVRKKASEFWAWQLLSEVYAHEPEKQMACLLRAVHCRTQESFLGKVRIKLASLYIQSNQYDRARHHIDAVTRCYLSQGWRLPHDVDCWIHQPWFNDARPNATDSVDYVTITNGILCEGTPEAIAVVTYVDPQSQRASIIYGRQKRMACKLKFNVEVGMVLKINYTAGADGKIKIISAVKTKFPNNLDYAKVVTGVVNKQDHNNFAFMRTQDGRCFISGDKVQKYGVTNGEQIMALIVYDYNKKKETWNWVCASIKR